jgi:hypothetical protein
VDLSRCDWAALPHQPGGAGLDLFCFSAGTCWWRRRETTSPSDAVDTYPRKSSTSPRPAPPRSPPRKRAPSRPLPNHHHCSSSSSKLDFGGTTAGPPGGTGAGSPRRARPSRARSPPRQRRSRCRHRRSTSPADTSNTDPAGDADEPKPAPRSLLKKGALGTNLVITTTQALPQWRGPKGLWRVRLQAHQAGGAVPARARPPRERGRFRWRHRGTTSPGHDTNTNPVRRKARAQAGPARLTTTAATTLRAPPRGRE